MSNPEHDLCPFLERNARRALKERGQDVTWVAPHPKECTVCSALFEAEARTRREIGRAIHTQVVPKLDEDEWDGGYNCCGCSTYGRIVDHVLEIVGGSGDGEDH